MEMTDNRVYNFNSGPSALPKSVLETAASEMLCYNGTGVSVMEMSHRSKAYAEIMKETEELMRCLLAIPENYKVLFLQGGATTQFSMAAGNLLTKSGGADYVKTGFWSERAIYECEKFGTVNVVASSEDKKYSYIPALCQSKFSKNADFFHITLNNTIYGTRFHTLPATGKVPLVTDASSCILAESIDVSKFGLIYAGAQKNIGPAGLTVVIIRDDLIRDVPVIVPTVMSYKVLAESASLYNTPPTYSIYMAMLVLRWLKELGGVSEIAKINNEKAGLMYEFLDNSNVFKPMISTENAESRSITNVTFTLPTEEQNAAFAKEAENNGFIGLKGHRIAGGLRASIYNAVPLDAVKALIQFMKKYETESN